MREIGGWGHLSEGQAKAGRVMGAGMVELEAQGCAPDEVADKVNLVLGSGLVDLATYSLGAVLLACEYAGPAYGARWAAVRPEVYVRS